MFLHMDYTFMTWFSLFRFNSYCRMNIVRKGMELFPHHCAILKALGHDIREHLRAGLLGTKVDI